MWVRAVEYVTPISRAREEVSWPWTSRSKAVGLALRAGIRPRRPDWPRARRYRQDRASPAPSARPPAPGSPAWERSRRRSFGELNQTLPPVGESHLAVYVASGG